MATFMLDKPIVSAQEPAQHVGAEEKTPPGETYSAYYLFKFAAQEYWKGRPVVKGDRISEADWPYPKEPEWEEDGK